MRGFRFWSRSCEARRRTRGKPLVPRVPIQGNCKITAQTQLGEGINDTTNTKKSRD